MKISCDYILAIIVVSIGCAIMHYNGSLMKILEQNMFKQHVDLQVSDPVIFTSEELLHYRGQNSTNNNKIYLSIIGKVYDVTKGEKHYGINGAYHVFAGRDVSRAFVTGEFTPDKLTDSVLDLSVQELIALDGWRKFYHREYTFVGKLTGKFYDTNGNATPYKIALENRFIDAAKTNMNKLKLQRTYPPCNVEWDSERGTRVWCTPKSGGITRNWSGFPRKFYEPGAKVSRCACISLELLSIGNIEEYDSCQSDATSCYIQT